MAYTLVAKQIGGSGSTPGNRVVYHIYGADTSLDLDDFTFTNSRGVTSTLLCGKIESIMNMGESSVLIDGKDYETGRWEVSQIGGIALNDPSRCAFVFSNQSKGNVIVEFRS
jgi:hypothetical protein